MIVHCQTGRSWRAVFWRIPVRIWMTGSLSNNLFPVLRLSLPCRPRGAHRLGDLVHLRRYTIFLNQSNIFLSPDRHSDWLDPHYGQLSRWMWELFRVVSTVYWKRFWIIVRVTGHRLHSNDGVWIFFVIARPWFEFDDTVNIEVRRYFTRTSEHFWKLFMSVYPEDFIDIYSTMQD